MFHIEGPQILDATVQNLVATVTGGSVFVCFLSRHWCSCLCDFGSSLGV